jgi:hypothetical protein
MTNAMLRATALAAATVVLGLTVSAPVLAAGGQASQDTAKKKTEGRTLSDYNIQKE